MQIQSAVRNAIAVAASGRAAVLAVEEQVKSLPQVDLPLEHGFAPGVYARKLFIPKGTVLTGKIHKYAHWNIVLQGHIEIMTEQGIKHIRAPAMFVSPAGTKRAGFAHEDTVWVTMHPTDETDIETIERETVVDTFEQLAEAGKSACPLLQQQA